MKKLLIILLFSNSIFASENLEPENSLFFGIHFRVTEDYHRMVLNTFAETYKEDVLIRVFVLPSFQPEYALGIRKQAEKYILFKLSPKLQLYAYTHLEHLKSRHVNLLEKNFPSNDKDENHELLESQTEIQNELKKLRALDLSYSDSYLNVPIARCEKEIQSNLAMEITNLWQTMLLETRFNIPEEIINDGTIFHYSMEANFHPLAGKTWSPYRETKAGKLVHLTETMSAYCEENNKVNLDELNKAKMELQNALNSR